MTTFLDTDVLVDCLRGTPAARAWLESNASESFQVPDVVAMELVAGCHDRADLRRTQRFIDLFDVTWPTASEFAHAFELLTAYHLSSRLGIPDCLIAAMALDRSARLHTFNLKHFRAVPGLRVEAPYERRSPHPAATG